MVILIEVCEFDSHHYYKNNNNMSKIRDNYLAEIIIILVVAVMLMSSCGSTYTCPSYSLQNKNDNSKII